MADSQYWGADTIFITEPMALDYEVAAIKMDKTMRAVGVVSPDYKSHLFQHRLMMQGFGNGEEIPLDCYVVAACCIVGELPSEVTSLRDFKEIPWPTINQE